MCFGLKMRFRDRKVDVLNFLKSLNLILKLDHYEAIPNMIYTM